MSKPSFEFSVTAPSGKSILDHLRVGPKSLAEGLLNLAARCAAARCLVLDARACSWVSMLPEFEEYTAAGSGISGAQAGVWCGYPVYIDNKLVTLPDQAVGHFCYEFGREAEGVLLLKNV